MEIAGIALLPFVAFILTIVSFVVDIIGFATPYWFYNKVEGVTHYFGLWNRCSSSSGTSVCEDHIDNLKSWFEATQAMEVLGFLCLLAALVVIILKLFVLKDKSVLKWVTIGCLAGAATFILIGVCIYGGEAPQNYTDNLHFAFAFVIIAAILAIVAAVLLCLDK